MKLESKYDVGDTVYIKPSNWRAKMMTTDEMIAVLTAAKNGAEIEWRRSADRAWVSEALPLWNFADYDYRVKPLSAKKIVKSLAWRDKGTGNIYWTTPTTVYSGDWQRFPVADFEGGVEGS